MICIRQARNYKEKPKDGLPSHSIRTRFRIEQTDVGTTMSGFNGYDREPKTIGPEDVGRVIETVRDGQDPVKFSWYIIW